MRILREIWIRHSEEELEFHWDGFGINEIIRRLNQANYLLENWIRVQGKKAAVKGKRVLKQILVILYYSLYACAAYSVVFWRAHQKGTLSYLSDEDYAVWKTTMLQMLWNHCLHGCAKWRVLIKAFCQANIEVIRKNEVDPEENNPIVTLCVKNDLRRLRLLVEHYRGLGVRRFAFLDNESTDGTFEWCMEQEDIDLYRCLEPYQTLVKEAWINRIVSYYGFNRWYILTDSDELLVYKGMETNPITDLVRYAEEHNFWRIRGLTLDTYTDRKVFSGSDDIRRDYRWIDTDSYRWADLKAGGLMIRSMVGGPRWRLMGSDASQSKFPLVFFSPGMVSETAHYQFPADKVGECPHQVGILHYKFLNGDQKEYRSRTDTKRGFRVAPYRKYFEYLDSHEGASFMYEGSVEFTDSSVLDRVQGLEPINLG